MTIVRALALISLIAPGSPSPSPSPTSAASPTPSPKPALAYHLRCAGYGNGSFRAAGIPVTPDAANNVAGITPTVLTPLTPHRSRVTIALLAGTLDSRYWVWLAQGTAAKPIDCELDREDADVTQRARYALAGVTVRGLSPAQPASSSALGPPPAADIVELDAASISLLSF